MAAATPKPVALSKLRAAFDYADGTAEIGGRAYMSLDTGRIHCVCEADSLNEDPSG